MNNGVGCLVRQCCARLVTFTSTMSKKVGCKISLFMSKLPCCVQTVRCLSLQFDILLLIISWFKKIIETEDFHECIILTSTTLQIQDCQRVPNYSEIPN